MKKSDNTLWLPGALAGVVIIGLLMMACGLGLSFGYRTVSVISFFSVLALLGGIAIIRRMFYPRTGGGD